MTTRAVLEFSDKTVSLVEVPEHLAKAKTLVSAKPGTLENVELDYVKTKKDGVRVYRERPVARVIHFPSDRGKTSP